MRKNTFGQTYCHTADELRSFLDQTDTLVEDVYVAQIDPPDPDGENEWDRKATAEVLTNDDGDTLCYIEADEESTVLTIMQDIGLAKP